MITRALIAVYCCKTRVLEPLVCRMIAIGCAGLISAGCSMLPVMTQTEETPEPVQASAPTEESVTMTLPVEPPVVQRTEPRLPKIVPNPTALFFGETESEKTLLLSNQGSVPGKFSFKVPEETFTTGDESVTFSPASGSVPAGQIQRITVRVERGASSCERILRLAALHTAQGARNIGVNYSEVRRPDFEIDRSGNRGGVFVANSNVIDFATKDVDQAEFTIMNRGCAAGTLTLLKSGLHEDKLDVPGGPFSVRSGGPQVIRLQRPEESFFVGTHSVTLLIRQDGATVDNVEIRWAGLPFLR